MKRLDKYINDVKSGVIPAGIHLKNAIDRFERDLLNPDFEFKEEKAQKVINFITTLRHTSGRYNNLPFILEPWQVFIVANLYGFYNVDGTRRFHQAYIEMARKQGKTALVAALSLYHLMEDGEAGGQILFSANSEDQARIGLNMVKGFAKPFTIPKVVSKSHHATKASEALKTKDSKLILHFSEIIYEDTNSFIKVLAADADKLDGYNCSFGVVDEYHSAPNSKVKDVLRSGQGMRVNPMLIIITTAGFNKSLPCYTDRTIATEIAAGIKQDNSLFAAIYAFDEEDILNWQDPSVWIKSNPNLGVTVNNEFLANRVLQATNNPSDTNEVMTKNLNIWCDAVEVWIPEDYIIKATNDKITIKDFYTSDGGIKSWGEECWVGADFAYRSDLTAVAYMFVKEADPYPIYNFFLRYYLPEDSLKAPDLKLDQELFKKWASAGYITLTPGNVTDFDYITKDLINISNNVQVKKIYYDQANAIQWAVQCVKEGLNPTPFSQQFGNFSHATKLFETLMYNKQIILEDNPITRYCLRNATLKFDEKNNCKPINTNRKNKIDGVIAMIQALAACAEIKPEKEDTITTPILTYGIYNDGLVFDKKEVFTFNDKAKYGTLENKNKVLNR